MDKSLENMDKRFKNLEDELNYKYDSKMWRSVDSMLDNSALDSAFINAAKTSIVAPIVGFEGVDNAFMDDAFVEASNETKINYESSFFKEFKSQESNLFQNDSFVSAAAMSSVIYEQKYWNDADTALQKEGLHHEYKADYWKAAEKLLLKDQRNGFFMRWGAVATVLLLLSIIGFNSNYNDFISENNSNSTTLNENNNSYSVENIANNDIVNSNETNYSENIGDSKSSVEKYFEDKKVNTKIEGGYIVSSDEQNFKSDDDGEFIESKELKKSDITYAPFDVNKKKQNDLLVKNGNDDVVSKYKRDTKFFLKESILLANLSKIDVAPPKVKSKHEIGVKLSKGIGTNFSEIKTTLSPRNSIFIDYRLNPSKRFNKVQLGFDMGLYHMSLDNYEFERNYSVYHMEGDVDHFWYKVTYKDLVFVSTSVNVYYQVSDVSKLKIGVGFDNLITSRIGLEYKNGIDETRTDAGVEWGVNDGMNKIDFNLGLGYELKLNNKFSFLLDTRIGVVDKTNNEYLHVNKMDRDLSVQLGIKYNIFASK